MQKPVWCSKRIDLKSLSSLKRFLRKLRLHSVCEESHCPNISECFGNKLATFLILGNSCTRQCSFCNISKGTPAPVDLQEPQRISAAVRLLGLGHVIITSPTRDDLEDGGAELFCQTVHEVKALSPTTAVEILIPDFSGNTRALEKIAVCSADVIAHNIETCPSLYIKVRKGADYQRSLGVLETVKKCSPRKVFTKSGLMLGLGEKLGEVLAVMEDLRSRDCDFLTLGQYLPPSKRHYPVKAYIRPVQFKHLQATALAMGFKGVQSAPYVRSSYGAHIFLSKGQ